MERVHTAELVYFNCQDMCSGSFTDVLLTGSYICKTGADHQNIKIVAFPFLCKANVQLILCLNLLTIRLYLRCTLKGGNIKTIVTDGSVENKFIKIQLKP